MLQFQRKHTLPDACAMLQAIQVDRPQLLWIQWSYQLQEPGRRPQVRTALEFFSGMVEQQLQYGGNVILEAKACDVPVRDELFAGARRLGALLGPPTRVHWCALGIMGGSDNNTLVCGEHLAMSNKPWQHAPCVCGRQSSTYVANEGTAYEQFVEKVSQHFDIIDSCQLKPTNTEWHHVQRQLKKKAGARDYVQQHRQYQPTADDSNDGAGIEKFPLRRDAATPPTKTVTFRGAQVQTFHVDRATSTADLDQSSPSPATPSSLPPQDLSSFPTDSHERAKAKKAQQEKDKTPEEIKAMRKRKPQEQEAHYDDCGSDLEPLMDNEAITALAMTDPCGSSFWFDSCGMETFFSCGDARPGDISRHLLDPEFSLSYLLGSDGEDTEYWLRRPPAGEYVKFDNLTTYLSKEERKGTDLLEISGGATGVTKLAVRRRLTTGGILDIVTGAD